VTETAHHTDHDVQNVLDGHSQSVHAMHQKLATMPQFSSHEAAGKLQNAIARHKQATQQFHDDVLGVTTNL
jgi:hypothetical protein